MPSITGVPECLKLRERCRIRARIYRKLLRDEADLPPWFLAISTPMESNESIRAFATPGPLAPHLTRPQSQPPRTPPANPLEGGLTTTCARPFGLEAQAQRGSSLVLRLRLASWGDRELVVERTAECEGEVARARPWVGKVMMGS